KDVTPSASVAKEAAEISAIMGADAAPADPAPENSLALPDAGPAESVAMTAANSEDATARPEGAPGECPAVEVLPDTKSITYFDDPEGKPTGKLVARASLTDIRGGCDYTADSVIVDI